MGLTNPADRCPWPNSRSTSELDAPYTVASEYQVTAKAATAATVSSARRLSRMPISQSITL